MNNIRIFHLRLIFHDTRRSCCASVFFAFARLKLKFISLWVTGRNAAVGRPRRVRCKYYYKRVRACKSWVSTAAAWKIGFISEISDEITLIYETSAWWERRAIFPHCAHSQSKKKSVTRSDIRMRVEKDLLHPACSHIRWVPWCFCTNCKSVTPNCYSAYFSLSPTIDKFQLREESIHG
jgi:hypothetical protein